MKLTNNEAAEEYLRKTAPRLLGMTTGDMIKAAFSAGCKYAKENTPTEIKEEKPKEDDPFMLQCMKERIISYETAKLAKRKGFNEKTRFAYYNEIDIRMMAVSYNWNNHNDGSKIKSKIPFLERPFYAAPTQIQLRAWIKIRIPAVPGWHGDKEADEKNLIHMLNKLEDAS